MKLQIAFDAPDIEQMLSLATTLYRENDIIEIGSPLLYRYGQQAIEQFRSKFPLATILADMKIVDRGKELSTIGIQAGADWITVLAGTSKSVIHTACNTAHAFGKKVMLDLIDASSPGQSALEATGLGVDALLFHKPADDEEPQLSFLEKWDMVRGNTKLPVFILAPITRTTLHQLLELRPAGMVISTTMLHPTTAAEDVAYYREKMQTY